MPKLNMRIYAAALLMTAVGSSAHAQNNRTAAQVVKPNHFSAPSAEKMAQDRQEAIARAAKFPCPDHPDLLAADVKASVTYDAATKMYRYAYTVTSRRNSLQPIKSISIDYVPDIKEIGHPAGWSKLDDAQHHNLTWVPVNPKLAAPLKPGQSAGPLTIESSNPPGLVHYYIEGIPSYPEALAERIGEAETEDMEVKCPDYAPAQRFPEGYLMGVTQGPSNAVAPAATTQLDKAGDISKIMILGSDTFDASIVDFSAIDFWPANLTVSSDRLQSMFNATQRHKDLVIDVSGLSLNGKCNQRDILIHGKLADGSEWRAAVPATSPDCIAERQAQKR